METEKVLSACTAVEEKYKATIEDESYQIRGAFNSEILLIIALAEHYGVSHIIESGRARGHSTNLLAKHFKDTDMRITSIDFDKDSADAKYSEKILQKYPNVEVVYGDAHKLAPANITEDCIVFIDGPKGDEAIELGIKMLDDKRVKAVCMHDFHRNHFLRNVCDMIFSNSFYTDEKTFVERFKYLDENCWQVLANTDYAPYLKYGKKSDSYAATLAAFENSENPTIQTALDNYRAYKASTKPSLGRWIGATLPHNSIAYKALSKIATLYKKK